MKEMLPTGPSGKIGKATKTFVYMYLYGAGIKKLQKHSGKSLRQIKVLKKRINNFGGMIPQ